MSSPEESGAPDIHQEHTNVWVRPCAGWPAHQARGLLRGPLLLPRNPEIQEDPKAKFSLHSEQHLPIAFDLLPLRERLSSPIASPRWDLRACRELHPCLVLRQGSKPQLHCLPDSSQRVYEHGGLPAASAQIKRTLLRPVDAPTFSLPWRLSYFFSISFFMRYFKLKKKFFCQQF